MNPNTIINHLKRIESVQNPFESVEERLKYILNLKDKNLLIRSDTDLITFILNNENLTKLIGTWSNINSPFIIKCYEMVFEGIVIEFRRYIDKSYEDGKYINITIDKYYLNDDFKYINPFDGG